MVYAAFFRGLNVGKNRQVKMADLQRLLTDCGFWNVQTLIQSGNAMFETDAEEASLPGRIETAFAQRFGFASPAAVRSADALGALLSAWPFSEAELAQAEAADPDVEHAYVYLSNRPVDAKAAEELRQAAGGEDRLIAGEREVYLLCRQSVRLPKLAIALLKLDPTFTNRNLNTLWKMQALIAARG